MPQRIPPTDRFQPVLVAHGTRSPHGVNTVARLAESVREQIGPTRVAFVDVLGPSPSELLRGIDVPALLIPAFLASGYHVRADIPHHVEASGHPHVTVCDNLGPDPVLAEVMHDRLRDCGWRPGDSVVLAAAGSSDRWALADVETAAANLGAVIGDEVAVGYVATARPRVADVVRALRRRRLLGQQARLLEDQEELPERQIVIIVFQPLSRRAVFWQQQAEQQGQTSP